MCLCKLRLNVNEHSLLTDVCNLHALTYDFELLRPIILHRFLNRPLRYYLNHKGERTCIESIKDY